MSFFDDFLSLRDDLVADFGVPLATVTSKTTTRSMSDRVAGRVMGTVTATRTVPALIETRSAKAESGEVVKSIVAKCFAAVTVGETITLGTTSGEIVAVYLNDPTGTAPYTWEATLK